MARIPIIIPRPIGREDSRRSKKLYVECFVVYQENKSKIRRIKNKVIKRIERKKICRDGPEEKLDPWF